MSLLSVVFRVLNKAGNGFVEPRREDGHGSSTDLPTHAVVQNFPQTYPLPADQLQALMPQGSTSSAPVIGVNTSVPASTTAVQLLAQNPARKGATIWNDSSLNAMRVSLGPVVSLESFTAIIASGGYFEVPFGYAGEITGLWMGPVGNARITEVQ